MPDVHRDSRVHAELQYSFFEPDATGMRLFLSQQRENSQ